MTQLMFGRFFWVWIVAFLGAASYLSAISINQLMRLNLAKKYKLPKIQGTLLGLNDKKLPAKVILGARNIFDPNGGLVTGKKKKVAKTKEKPKKEPVLKSTVEGCPPIQPGKAIPESKIRTVRLKGTSYVEKDPEQSVAAVFVKVKVKKGSKPAARRRSRRRKRYRRRRKRRRRYYRRSSGRWRWQTEVFRVGDLMMEKMRVCVIGPKEVIFYHQRKLQKLSLEKKKKKRRLRYYGALGIAQPKKPSDTDNVRVDSIDKRTINRSLVQNWINNPMAHASSARVMPVRTGGLRLVWVRKKSIYSKLGLKTGDTVLSVNGKKLNINNALGLYSQLPYAKNLKVNIVRRGSRRQLQFNIK